MKLMRTEDAVGSILCQDVTQIIKDRFKGPVFRKGHVIQAEDIPVLLSIGKEHLYVWEQKEGILHENDAAAVLRDLCQNRFMTDSEPKEGKIELRAAADGLFKVRTQALLAVNETPEMMIATRHGNMPVKKGDLLAGMRIIPLAIEEEKMKALKAEVEKITEGKPILSLKPYVHKKAGIVTTGSEVFKGRISDTFTPVVVQKLQEYGAEISGHIVTDDNADMTTEAVMKLIAEGADLVVCTGGMSVDPDDRTPLAIRNTGAEIVTYGSPVLPGAMFMMGYLKTADRKEEPEEGTAAGLKCILGLPGCVMYARRTVFDLMLPRIMADDRITGKEIASHGEGGLCLSCETCTWPNCGFGA
jgi:molybdenum cofactor synthesis domain-containing protein